MSKYFNEALKQASYTEFSWIDTFENPYNDYVFSKEFEDRMQEIVNQSKYAYLGMSGHRFRKKFILILIATLALLISGYAIAHYYIQWNEIQNDDYGTLDVEFEIDENLPDIDVDFIYPSIPSGYNELEKTNTTRVLMLQYQNNQGEIISYSQEIGLAGMGSISINNETEMFEEVPINGFKGYYSKNDNVNTYIWTDGYCLYTLQRTCSKETLLKTIESIDNNKSH